MLGVAGAVGFGLTGCSPRLASVGTEGLLTRSFSNYSQSTVVRSEQLVTSNVPLASSRTPVPKKETTRYGASGEAGTGDRVERKRSQVIAPEGYASEPSAGTSGGAGERSVAGQRSAGIPKVKDDRAAAGFRNMKFVSPEQVRPVRSVEKEATREQQAAPAHRDPVQPQTQTQDRTQRQPESQRVQTQTESKSSAQRNAQTRSISQGQTKDRVASDAQTTSNTQSQRNAQAQSQPASKSQIQAKPQTQPTRQPVVAQRTASSNVTYTSGRKTYPAAGTTGQSGASTRVSTVVPTPTKQDQRSVERQRKAESKRLVEERRVAETEARQAERTARKAQIEQEKRERELALIAAAEARQVAAIRASNRASSGTAATAAEAHDRMPEETAASEAIESQDEPSAVASPKRVVSVAELQRQLRQASATGGEAAVEDFLPGISAALSQQATAMPTAGVTSKPVPEFIRTPAEENTVVVAGTDDATVAVAPPKHAFKPLETEHVKFSYYDPFGEGNNRFVVVLHEQRFCYPYRGRFLSGYGPRGRSVHTGVDIKGVKNDTVRAAFAGTVRMSKFYSGYGNCVVIRHKNGLETLYGHNNVNLVRVGDEVRAGDPIGLIGRTGRATTEHCHFEVRVQGQHINPALILDYQNMKLRSGVLAVTKQANGQILAINRASGLAPSTGMDTEDTGTAVASATSVSATKSSGGNTSASGTTPSVYTVRSGDTLWGIARRFGTTISKLCALNNLDREATLPLGKKLKIR